MSLKPRRRWYQFSLRAMLVVTAILCVGPGAYVAYEQNKAQKYKAIVGRIEKLGGMTTRPVSTERLPVLKTLLGDDTYEKTTRVWLNDTAVTDSDLILIAQLPNLETLDLGISQVSDTGLSHLRNLKCLEELSLDKSRITDAGLIHLVELKSLRTVHLEGRNESRPAFVTSVGRTIIRLGTMTIPSPLTSSPLLSRLRLGSFWTTEGF